MPLSIVYVDTYNWTDTQLYELFSQLVPNPYPRKEHRLQHSPKRTNQKIIGELLVKSLLSIAHKTKLSNIEINRQTDKPTGLITKKKQVTQNFSLSHTGTIIACITHPNTIGLDIEIIKQRDNFDDLARIFMSETELNKFNTLTRPQKSNYFYSIWTLKEAYNKALGKSLFENIRGTSFDVSENSANVELWNIATGNTNNWELISGQHKHLSSDICYSVAIQNYVKDRHLEHKFYSPSTLYDALKQL